MMKRAVAVALMTILPVCLIAQTNTPKIPKTCGERNLLRDEKGKIVWFTHEQMKAKATKMVKPEMSPLVRGAARIQGAVIVGVVVGKDSRVKCVWLIHGHPLLAPDVVKAVQQWTFTPAMQKSKPISFSGYLEFHFNNGYEF